ncbi:hypothetical protein LXL04_029934 [Taraxacum kok-saghyz]
MSAVCGPYLQTSVEEEVNQTSAVCKKKTVTTVEKQVRSGGERRWVIGRESTVAPGRGDVVASSAYARRRRSAADDGFLTAASDDDNSERRKKMVEARAGEENFRRP